MSDNVANEEPEIPGFLRAGLNQDGWPTGQNIYFDPFTVTSVRGIKTDGPTAITIDRHEYHINGGAEYWVRAIALFKNQVIFMESGL